MHIYEIEPQLKYPVLEQLVVIVLESEDKTWDIVRREPESAARRAYATTMKEKLNRGRQKLKWSDVIQRDMEQKRIADGTWRDRNQWRKLCRTADPV